MKNSQFKLAALASAMVLMSAAGGAQAGSYALSSENIQGFTIAFTNVTPGISIDTSTASASLNATTVGPVLGTGVSDAPVASVGTPVVTNNSQFAGNTNTPIGQTGTNYSYADALITHNGPGGIGLPFNAQTIAESHLATTGAAGGTSTNSSATGITATVVAGAGGVLKFDFDADPLIRTFLQVNGGLFAQGTLSASLSISCASLGGCGTRVGPGGVLIPIAYQEVVFGWSPDGVVGHAGGVTGTVGGDETADAENLNLTVSNFNPPAGALNFSDAATLGHFSATTNALGAGAYTLSLSMTSTDATIKAVPEPATIGLLGLGLAGLGLSIRRRKA